MAKATVYDYYKDLPTWGKGVLAAGAAFGAYKIYKAVEAAAKARKEREEQAAVNKELKTSLKKYPATYGESQYLTWSNSLQAYMVGSGTDKNGIMAIMNKLKNDSDFLLLKKAFGLRTYHYAIWNYGKKTLGAWLAIEDSWMEDLVEDINAVLRKKGIKYRF